MMLVLPLFLMMATPSPFAPIAVYQGTWTVTSSKSAKAQTMVNRCVEGAAFYACEQTLDGRPVAMVVYALTTDPHRFNTQAILPDGTAAGKTELVLSGANGSHWTFTNQGTGADGKPIYFKVENDFTGTDRIHFVQFDSPDGKTWTERSSGDEVRVRQLP
jgi:hypothetical protein